MLKLKTIFCFAFSCSLFSFLNLGAQCACNSYSEFDSWQPELLEQRAGEWEMYYYTATGTYVAEDKTNYYIVRLLSDQKEFGVFIYYQKLIISRKDESVFKINPNEFYYRNYDVKKSFNQRYVASEFFDSEMSFLVDKKQKPAYFVKCGKNKDEFGFYSQSENRFYKKVSNYPLGQGKYVFTSMRSISQKDLKSLKKPELKEMRNEIFARYHFIFKQDGIWDKHFSQYDWYHEFNDNVDTYLTYIEKENAKYILGFEGAEYYDDQLNNDFMDFWSKLRQSIIKKDTVALLGFISLPLKINGELDEMPVKTIKKEEVLNVWNMIMQQINYNIGPDSDLSANINLALFKEKNPFQELMLRTKQNSLGAFHFEKINGNWKIVSLYADLDNYNKIK